mgnify:CR=1 FL=1
MPLWLAIILLLAVVFSVSFLITTLSARAYLEKQLSMKNADNATSLAAPVRGLMDGRIEESMTSVIRLTLSDTATGQVIYSGKGRNGSVEISGDIQTLMPH